MGVYLNPGNSGFERIMRSDYIDKTMLAGTINKTINAVNNLTCVSRPRRFGKSYAAQMLCAYYGKGEDSHPLFDSLKIAQSKDYNGLTKTIAELIGGVEVGVETLGFANDLTTFRGTDTQRGNTPGIPEVDPGSQA